MYGGGWPQLHLHHRSGMRADPQKKKKKSIKAQQPGKGRTGLHERQIKGGETKEETVKAEKRMGELEEAPLEPRCWRCGVGGLSASLWLGGALCHPGLRMQTSSLRQIQVVLEGRAGQRHQALCQSEPPRDSGVWTHSPCRVGSYCTSVQSGQHFTGLCWALNAKRNGT